MARFDDPELQKDLCKIVGVCKFGICDCNEQIMKKMIVRQEVKSLRESLLLQQSKTSENPILTPEQIRALEKERREREVASIALQSVYDLGRPLATKRDEAHAETEKRTTSTTQQDRSEIARPYDVYIAPQKPSH